MESKEDILKNIDDFINLELETPLTPDREDDTDRSDLERVFEEMDSQLFTKLSCYSPPRVFPSLPQETAGERDDVQVGRTQRDERNLAKKKTKRNITKNKRKKRRFDKQPLIGLRILWPDFDSINIENNTITIVIIHLITQILNMFSSFSQCLLIIQVVL
ncbi:Hypothetical protein CINCED_3A008921 [Cinara cedri]|uniref:Uncharacterized protein n=1 Tax=Cinara cedri TaxID=506608 RepID=A0A5E4MRV9_9HEMI|nr:Hypothetical protein CINCED_3A008921 [Cinara cedri]